MLSPPSRIATVCIFCSFIFFWIHAIIIMPPSALMHWRGFKCPEDADLHTSTRGCVVYGCMDVRVCVCMCMRVRVWVCGCGVVVWLCDRVKAQLIFSAAYNQFYPRFWWVKDYTLSPPPPPHPTHTHAHTHVRVRVRVRVRPMSVGGAG